MNLAILDQGYKYWVQNLLLTSVIILAGVTKNCHVMWCEHNNYNKLNSIVSTLYSILNSYFKSKSSEAIVLFWSGEPQASCNEKGVQYDCMKLNFF